MYPLRAVAAKKDVECHVNCYSFEIYFETEVQSLLINLNTNTAYFLDDSSSKENNYFSTDWVQDLIHHFEKNPYSQNFEYNFKEKIAKRNSPSLFQGIIASRENSPVLDHQKFESISFNSHCGF